MPDPPPLSCETYFKRCTHQLLLTTYQKHFPLNRSALYQLWSQQTLCSQAASSFVPRRFGCPAGMDRFESRVRVLKFKFEFEFELPPRFPVRTVKNQDPVFVWSRLNFEGRQRRVADVCRARLRLHEIRRGLVLKAPNEKIEDTPISNLLY